MNFKHWLSLIGLSLFSFVIVLGVQFGARLYLQSQLTKINYKIGEIKSQVDKNENADLKKKIKAVNDLTSDYNNLVNSSPKWSKLLKVFSVIPPEGVRITNFAVDLNKKQVTINGISPTRDLVIKLYENIKADKEHFYNVNYPLENVAKATNISFHYSFNFKDGIIN